MVEICLWEGREKRTRDQTWRRQSTQKQDTIKKDKSPRRPTNKGWVRYCVLPLLLLLLLLLFLPLLSLSIFIICFSCFCFSCFCFSCFCFSCFYLSLVPVSTKRACYLTPNWLKAGLLSDLYAKIYTPNPIPWKMLFFGQRGGRCRVSPGINVTSISIILSQLNTLLPSS